MTTFCEKLFLFISDYIKTTHYSPSFAEMTQAMGISAKSKSLITKSLRKLKKSGKVLLEKEGRRLRISLCNEHIVLLGRVSLGLPIETIENDEYLKMNTLFPGLNRFALQVKGASMIDEGILDGDMIICRKADCANEGDVVVVSIDDHHTTLKRISFQIKNMITLIPANTTLKPRAYPLERIKIQGVYIGLVRMVTADAIA